MSAAALAPGRKLSAIRQHLGMSQRKAAELSGLTHSAISTIEQDKVSPAVSTLQKLLRVYGLSLAEFFAEKESEGEPRVVFNADQLLEIGSSGVSLKMLSHDAPAQSMIMLLETYQPGSRISQKLKHHCKEVGTLLEGEIILTLDGLRYSLRAGQSYIIDSAAPHSFSNHSTRVCRLVSAHSPHL